MYVVLEVNEIVHVLARTTVRPMIITDPEH